MSTSAVVDGCAKVIAGAVNGHIFAAGVTASVLADTPLVVPFADDFAQAGLPAVTCALGDWTAALMPGTERLTMTILCVVWRLRDGLASVAALLADRDAIADAWIAHSKAFLAEPTVQSAILAGGPGLVPRSLGEGARAGAFLTLPFKVNVVLQRTVVPQPA